MTLRLRKGAWRSADANGWFDDLRWYAAGVHQMRRLSPQGDELSQRFRTAVANHGPDLTETDLASLREITDTWSDPASWGYQGQVHGACDPRRDRFPSHEGVTVIWDECAHEHWFFLPWHRAYLLEFETVVRQHIKNLDGPADTWGLPYWDYSDHAEVAHSAELPLPFREPALPDGVDIPGVDAVGGQRPNPLFDPSRAAGLNAGSLVVWAAAGAALDADLFFLNDDTSGESFGGGFLEDPSTFHRGSEMGALDLRPHGSVHAHVGGNMRAFQTAGLDPVFWLHHCNIDRLWETWARDLGHGYPFPADDGTAPSTSWHSQVFPFLRPDGTRFEWRAPELTEIAELGYAYDVTVPPADAPQVPRPPHAAAVERRDRRPEPVAWSSDMSIAGVTELTLKPARRHAAAAEITAAGEDRWILEFDGIVSNRPAVSSYLVFLGLGPNEHAGPDDTTHFVGVLSLFGVFEATMASGHQGGSGASRRFDITDNVQQLGGTFDPAASRVRLVPIEDERDDTGVGLRIGRTAVARA